MSTPQRKLSPWRVLLAIVILVVLGAGTYFGVQRWQANQRSGYHPWFAAYVDVTATPAFAFEQLGATSTRNAVLSFVVASKADACTPTWGGVYTLDQARGALDLDRRIARLQQQNGSVTVSFGGLSNQELAVACTDATALQQAYRAVIDRYQLDTIDLDLEKDGLTDPAAAKRRAIAIAALQTERRAQGKPLAVWLTLPVAPQGLTQDGTNAISSLLQNGVDVAGVNVMTMNYGSSRSDDQSMVAAAEAALIQTQRQLGVLYDRAGTHLNDATLWAKIGATPMIGQNDVASEVFTLDDAKQLNAFVHERGAGRVSMWSANRDAVCGGNYVDTKIVSDSCSGVPQEKGAFGLALGRGYDEKITASAGVVTAAEPVTTQIADDPKNSPYQIWSESNAYLQGTKVVWHHNVYQAKWWTQGDMPDNPVLQTWETPWELIGPVLPGEKPLPQATLPAGTYPEWSGSTAYNTGQRVLFNGVPYQAKWWNQGQSPATASSNANDSSWAPLTQEQVNSVLAHGAGAQ